jgi:hypothetical protein
LQLPFFSTLPERQSGDSVSRKKFTEVADVPSISERFVYDIDERLPV